MRLRLSIAALMLLPVLAGCSRPSAVFNVRNARAHVNMLAGTIGNRTLGTPDNARARDYILDQLRIFGFDVRVQEADARRPEIGRTARVSNIIAVRGGARNEAIGLVAHYDSSPDAPGAADDGFGVAVVLEAARVLGSVANRNWSLMVLLTDGEEMGLMGAAALLDDREVARRLQTYLNIEAIGSASPVWLFESGPGNAWLLRPWARAAPNPSGGSFGLEIYRQLPNDTDFSILKRLGVPGLNFAAVGDSYAYHTARDTPERVTDAALRDAGENVVAIVDRLEGIDITQRSDDEPTYFDIAGTVAASYGPVTSVLAAVVALLLGAIAWLRVTREAIRMGGPWRLLLTFVWTVLGAALALGAMVAMTWALRSVREVYHPWYARPDRLFLLMAIAGAAVGWSVARIGRWLPRWVHGLRHPVVTWSVALPFWIVLAGVSLWYAPAAAYLWTMPLLAAGLLLAIVPAASGVRIRLASLLIFVVTASMWLFETVDLLRFMVAVFGRFPIITPVYAYAALMGLAGVMIVPPLVGAASRQRPLVRPSLMTAALLLAAATVGALAYVAPAYTFDEPLRRRVRAVQPAHGSAIWEVAGVEPGLDLGENAPEGWMPAAGALPGDLPWTPLSAPFVFRTETPPLGPAPATVGAFALRPLAGGIELELSIAPREPGVAVTLLLPPGITPARASLPGLERRGRWQASYVALPPEGLVLKASFSGVDPAALRKVEVLVTAWRFPGGTGPQGLPAWLPQDRMVWSGTALWQLLPGEDAIAPVPPLR